MIINSGLRTLAQQLMLYTWYQQHRCGITAAAAPGNSIIFLSLSLSVSFLSNVCVLNLTLTGKSNHNSGLAVDIQDAPAWKTAMASNGWVKLGDWDPMHYDYKGN